MVSPTFKERNGSTKDEKTLASAPHVRDQIQLNSESIGLKLFFLEKKKNLQ